MSQPAADLPPFPALRAFHAAARHQQFREAAKELGLTESAISHQVRRLESYLRVQLFERQGPKVRLTDAGSRYFKDIDPALGALRAATRSLMGPAERTRVALTLPPSFAVLWLIPKMGGFELAHPGIDLRLVTTTRLCDLEREEIDLAIRHGPGGWSDVEAEFLLEETVMPVCRPGFLNEAQLADVATMLKSARLIINGYHPEDWIEWARARGVEPPEMEGAFRLETQEQALEAAESGLGIAMGRSPLADRRVQKGALIAPFGRPDPLDTAYFICRAKGSTGTAASRRVAAWLRQIAAADQEGAANSPG